MRPVRLTMSAFGSYAEAEVVDFSGLEGIFLVTGDTGAGKTTIFDGMVYALYDRTSGGVRDGNMMRSAYADLRTPTFVELTFSCRGGEYRVVRNPDYERESLRRDKGGDPKKTQEKSRVELYLPDGSAFRGNKRDVNRKIEDLIGLNARQFMQVAMIAQGDFLKLLLAKSEERKEIFSRIFDTGIYGTLQEELRRREKEDYVRVKEKEQAVKEQMNRILCPKDWEGCEELAEAQRTENFKEAVALLGRLGEEEGRRAKTLADRREEKKQEIDRLAKVQELAEGILALQRKQEEQQEWLAENLPKESQFREQTEKAEAALEKKQEEERRLTARQEKELREFKETERSLQERLRELLGMEELWESVGCLRERQDEAAKGWETANAAYRKKNSVYEEIYEAFFREQAGILAQGLEAGTPCPVCGSRVHPEKAEASREAPDQAQVRKAKQAVKKAEESREGAQEIYRSAAEGCREATGSLTQEGRRLFGQDFGAQEETWRSKAAMASEEARKALEVCQGDYEKRKGQSQAEKKELEKDVARCRQDFQEAKDGLETFIRRAERIRGEAKAAGEQEAALRREWKEKDAAKDITETAKKGREGLLRLQEEMKALEHGYQEVYSRQQSNRTTWEVLRKYEKEYLKLREHYTMVRHLSQTAGGALAGTAKIDFESYVQRQYFERVIQRANQRLVQMSEGQFLLKCKDMEQLESRGKVGLDLDVYSLVTETVRDVKTLSGGESFMAALSMALGLADVIRDSAGAIRLDTMFIDEGFGSLDDNAREQAIRVLYELTGENRLIGIISHVSELKEQIETKLTVTKTKNGSHAQWRR